MIRAIVIGRSDTVWQEFEEAKKMIDNPVLIAINHSGRDYDGQVDHWVSYHPDLFRHWIDQRKRAGRADQKAVLWTGTYSGQKIGDKLKSLNLHRVICTGGSSGLLAVNVALDGINADRVVLCGIPLSEVPRYDDPKVWKEALVYRAAWRDEYERLKDRVRSMSGWTQELLGAPTKEWLA